MNAVQVDFQQWLETIPVGDFMGPVEDRAEDRAEDPVAPKRRFLERAQRTWILCPQNQTNQVDHPRRSDRTRKPPRRFEDECFDFKDPFEKIRRFEAFEITGKPIKHPFEVEIYLVHLLLKYPMRGSNPVIVWDGRLKKTAVVVRRPMDGPAEIRLNDSYITLRSRMRLYLTEAVKWLHGYPNHPIFD